jgi:hypothetical protein
MAWGLVGAGLLIASLAVSGVLVSGGSHASPASASSSRTLTSSMASASAQSTPPAGARRGRPGNFWGGAGFAGRMGGFFTVTGVNSGTDTITATGRGKQTITITVATTTTYTMARQSISLGQITTGEQIAVRGARTSATAISASSITVVLPTESGKVTNLSPLTISGFNNTSHTIDVGSSTTYTMAGQRATLGDIAIGTFIVAQGTTNSGSSLNALMITIQTPRAGGQVSASSPDSVGGTAYTITERQNGTMTIDGTGSTVYVGPSGATVNSSTIVKGTFIMAEGTLSTDGKTLTALRITVMPARTGNWGPGRGFGNGKGGFGHRGGPGGWATPSPTAAATAGTGV